MRTISYLSHHGIKGQKWGVRRYQNPDGTLTEEGKRRYKAIRRVKNASATKADVDAIIASMSSTSKDMLEASDGYLDINQGEYVIKRFIINHENTPIAFFDVLSDGSDEKGREHVNIALGVNENYHGHGYGKQVAKQGSDWLKKNRSKLGNITWSTHQDNIASQILAERNGFVYDELHSNEKWKNYGLQDRRKGK